MQIRLCAKSESEIEQPNHHSPGLTIETWGTQEPMQNASGEPGLKQARRRSALIRSAPNYSQTLKIRRGRHGAHARSLRGNRGGSPQMPVAEPVGCGIWDGDRHPEQSLLPCRGGRLRIRRGSRAEQSACMRGAAVVPRRQQAADANSLRWPKGGPVQQVQLTRAWRTFQMPF